MNIYTFLLLGSESVYCGLSVLGTHELLEICPVVINTAPTHEQKVIGLKAWKWHTTAQEIPYFALLIQQICSYANIVQLLWMWHH